MGKKVNPVIIIAAAALALYVVFRWWPANRNTVLAKLGAGTAAASLSPLQALGQKAAGLLDKVQGWAAKAAIVFPPLAVLTPKTLITDAGYVATGAGYAWTGVSDAGSAIGSAASATGSAIGSAASATGSAIGSAASATGGAVAGAARTVVGWL